MQVDFAYEWGETVIDTFTKFRGVVTGAASYPGGLVRFLVETKAHDGTEKVQARWIDAIRLQKYET